VAVAAGVSQELAMMTDAEETRSVVVMLLDWVEQTVSAILHVRSFQFLEAAVAASVTAVLVVVTTVYCRDLETTDAVVNDCARETMLVWMSADHPVK
jgi:hypothetical protein